MTASGAAGVRPSAGERVLMFGLGPVELILIAAILLMVFGVGRLGEAGGIAGATIREFRRNLAPPTAPPPAPAPPAPGAALRRDEI